MPLATWPGPSTLAPVRKPTWGCLSNCESGLLTWPLDLIHVLEPDAQSREIFAQLFFRMLQRMLLSSRLERTPRAGVWQGHVVSVGVLPPRCLRVLDYVEVSTPCPWAWQRLLCVALLMTSFASDGPLLGSVGLVAILLLAPIPRLTSHGVGIQKTLPW